jgi:hypothetical protein
MDDHILNITGLQIKPISNRVRLLGCCMWKLREKSDQVW